MKNHLGGGGLWFVIVIGLLSQSNAMAQDSERFAVTVGEGQSLRDIAQEYLGDPDLWSEILRANNLDAITDVKPGIELQIPVTQISNANRALSESLEAIQVATREGARLFAPDEIAAAIRLRESAVAERKAGTWEKAAELAHQAVGLAEQALALATKQRDAAAEALLSDREGTVEGQKSQELVWSDRLINALLIEEEKVRTLSRSSAQITFRDDSRLRLNANSQAVIQRIRVDPLSRREEAKVSLIEGDFYALLGGNSQRKKFEIEIPEVETEIDSRNFWVRRDVSGSKFTNFDEQVLRVAAQGASVDLGRNEGTLVRSGQAPSAKVDILQAPALVGPSDDSVAFNATSDLQWQQVTDAAGYWVEIAYDPGFNRMTVSRWGLTEPSFEVAGVDIGSYYWRVAGLDKFGLPGERSEVWRFHVRVDRTAPFLKIDSPGEGDILRESPLPLHGESEPNAVLSLDRKPLATSDDGTFEVLYQPQLGRNELIIEARDEAGNVTRRNRSFVYMPDEAAAVRFDDNLPRRGPRDFVTERDVVSLAGEAEPLAQLVVRAADRTTRASAYVDGTGRFSIDVPVVAATEAFDLEVVTRSGYTTKDSFTVAIDREPPGIQLEAPPPTVTAVEWLPLRGRAPGATRLTLNGVEVPLLDDAFDQSVTLRQGANTIDLVAIDLVGNVLVDKFDVELDQMPPTLVRQSVSKSAIEGGESVTVEVVAEDSSGLKQAAPFTIRVGSTEVSDFLEFNRAAGSYRATVFLPEAGAVVLKEVELEDYAGNRQRYSFE